MFACAGHSVRHNDVVIFTISLSAMRSPTNLFQCYLPTSSHSAVCRLARILSNLQLSQTPKHVLSQVMPYSYTQICQAPRQWLGNLINSLGSSLLQWRQIYFSSKAIILGAFFLTRNVRFVCVLVVMRSIQRNDIVSQAEATGSPIQWFPEMQRYRASISTFASQLTDHMECCSTLVLFSHTTDNMYDDYATAVLIWNERHMKLRCCTASYKYVIF